MDDLSEPHAEELRRIARSPCKSELDEEALSDEDLAAIRLGEQEIQGGRAISLAE